MARRVRHKIVVFVLFVLAKQRAIIRRGQCHKDSEAFPVGAHVLPTSILTFPNCCFRQLST